METGLAKLQAIDNRVYRKILGGPKYTAVCALKGELGSSLMKTRIMDKRVQYVKTVLTRK